MQYNVTILKHVFLQDGETLTFWRQMMLPFAPFPGLRLHHPVDGRRGRSWSGAVTTVSYRSDNGEIILEVEPENLADTAPSCPVSEQTIREIVLDKSALGWRRLTRHSHPPGWKSAALKLTLAA